MVRGGEFSSMDFFFFFEAGTGLSLGCVPADGEKGKKERNSALGLVPAPQ